MHQTEMIRTLIDTYSSGSNNDYVLNPCQMAMPNIDYPAKYAANLNKSNDRFQKPIWFIPHEESDFVRGVPKKSMKIAKPAVEVGLRKCISGLLRVAGFTETNESALVMMVDALDQFYKLLLENTRSVLLNEEREEENKIDILTLEKGYFGLTKQSLTSLHNYYKHENIHRNKTEITEFKETFQEYDKLLQENNMVFQQQQQQQQDANNYIDLPTTIKEEDYSNFFDSTSNIPQQMINPIALHHNRIQQQQQPQLNQFLQPQFQQQYITVPNMVGNAGVINAANMTGDNTGISIINFLDNNNDNNG